MTNVRLKYVNTFRDRHGVLRRYFRRPGGKAIRLPGLPGSAEFLEAYSAALVGEVARTGPTRVVPGTVRATVAAYLASGAFMGLAPETQRGRRSVLEAFAKEHGDKGAVTLSGWGDSTSVVAPSRSGKGRLAPAW
jgi:hypothetical protein